ncbi:MAG: UDP-N-acetylglucosamine 2-epimerase (non-hydrolyzing) [Calditrichia bacterium]
MKIVSIVGARPQFIKYGPLGRKLKREFEEVLIHTGQHYDRNMSDLLFKDLNIPEPDINLGIGSHPQGKQTALMMEGIEKALLRIQPDVVIVFGDTNSTLAGALAAVKLHIGVAHVEAGLRSFNKQMPEEINRVLTDHCSDILLCPTENAVVNLKTENITRGVSFCGDIMYEAFLENVRIAGQKSEILQKEALQEGSYYLATVHRAENTDNPDNLWRILSAFNELDRTVIFPVHPRTRQILKKADIRLKEHVKLWEPVGYLDMLVLLEHARKVLTDSGGLQKEAYFAGRYCKTLRNETEWIETLKNGRNVLCGTDSGKIVQECLKSEEAFGKGESGLFGDGHTSEHIVQTLKQFFNEQ